MLLLRSNVTESNQESGKGTSGEKSYIREASNHEKLKKWDSNSNILLYSKWEKETNPGCLVLSGAYSNLKEEKLSILHTH